MTTALVFTIIFAAIMFAIAVINRQNYHRLLDMFNEKEDQLKVSDKEKKLLKEEITRITRVGGISESTVLSLISEIARIDNNLYHMQDVPGRKQISKALDRMKVALQAEDYTIAPLLGATYRDGMQVSAVFVPDERLLQGESVITSVQKPQVNRAGKMIQAASVTVAQNI